jgi:hypothetical protein
MGFIPPGGRAARDARFLSHGAVECQSKRGLPCPVHRIWLGFGGPGTAIRNPASAQKPINLPLWRAENAEYRASSMLFPWHIACFVD